MEIRDRKAAQRRAGIMARRGLPQAERAAANAAICARILTMPCFQKAENLLLYAAFGGEVDLAGLAEQAARLGKTVAYPVCGENFTLTAAVPGPDGWGLGPMASARRFWNGRRSSGRRRLIWCWCPAPPLMRPAAGWAWARATMTAICPGAGTPWRWAWPLGPSGCRKRLQMGRTGGWMDL